MHAMSQHGFFDPDWPSPDGAGDAPVIIYGYVPSKALCILALVTFSICFIWHLFRVIQVRAWSMIPIPFACVMELVGYSFRFQSANTDPYRINFFVLNYFFIVIAPVFLSASVYVCLSRLFIWAAVKGFSNPIRVHTKFVLIAFVCCDVIATVIQVTGAALIGHAESNRRDPTTPNNILLAGLAFQAASFSVYLFMLGIFTISVLQSFSSKRVFIKELRWFSSALWTASLLVFIRTLFRLAEASQGLFGFAMIHEVFFGTLDFAPIITTTFMLAIWYPGKYLPNKTHTNNEKDNE